ncbi:hypothetical protein [Amaricoccus sp.]|uniref:hypothetical protein n=1 Tax=Amaricoccus sp. TaxID=1872485 RepID=UPI00260B918C|nr:hypothetical protein [uncultured Amaricoccus sp.]
MERGLVMLFASLWLAACGSSEPPSEPSSGPSVTAAPVRAVPCDDGGSGGVLIDGVCL